MGFLQSLGWRIITANQEPRRNVKFFGWKLLRTTQIPGTPQKEIICWARQELSSKGPGTAKMEIIVWLPKDLGRKRKARRTIAHEEGKSNLSRTLQQGKEKSMGSWLIDKIKLSSLARQQDWHQNSINMHQGRQEKDLSNHHQQNNTLHKCCNFISSCPCSII